MNSPEEEDDDRPPVPNFIKLDEIPANFAQRLETDLLEPVVFNQGTATSDGFTRFTLQNKGFLHSHSKIFLSLAPQHAGNKYFFSPHVGVGQVVKKCVLKIGNKIVNEVDSWNALHSFKSSLITNENNLEREQYTTGRVMNHAFRYDEGSRTLATDYGLDNGNEYLGDVLHQPGWAEMDANALAECPTYSIDLSDLFPFLKVNQLPLYMMKEAISIELTFMPTQQQRCQLGDGTADKQVHIVRDDLKFCADYIYYGTGAEMDLFAKKNRSTSFSFVDYREIEQTVNASSLGSGIIRNLGMANRLVPRVIVTTPNAAVNETNILGSLSSVGPFINAAGVTGTIAYNIRYNDRFEFSSDLSNSARLFSMTTHAESVPPFITRQEFCGEGVGGGLTSEEYEGIAQTDLARQFFYLSTKLSNGRVGQRGIELHLKGVFPSSKPTLIRCFCEYIRTMRIVDGITEIYNS